jgi:hypothetical protein
MAKEELKEEEAFFEERRDAWLKEHPDRYVLVKGRKAQGFYESQMEAIRRGYEIFGHASFLVKHLR